MKVAVIKMQLYRYKGSSGGELEDSNAHTPRLMENTWQKEVVSRERGRKRANHELERALRKDATEVMCWMKGRGSLSLIPPSTAASCN